MAENNKYIDTPTTQQHFRAVLPHEPLPKTKFGYIQIQGALHPKPAETTNANNDDHDDKDNTHDDNDDTIITNIENTLLSVLRSTPLLLPSHLGSNLLSIQIDPCLTKARLTYSSPRMARNVTSHFRRSKITPSQLLPSPCIPHTSTKPIQATLVTPTPLPRTPCWHKTTPPGFRRLIPKGGSKYVGDTSEIEKRKDETRFVFVTGILPRDCDVTVDNDAMVDIVRSVADEFDSSGDGVEVFLPSKKKKFGSGRYCYVGLRSHEDAARLLSGLNGARRDVCVPRYDDGGDDGVSSELTTTTVTTDVIFCDWADMTYRSLKYVSSGDAAGGLPSRSECTSTTDDVVVPGLYMYPSFLTEEQEEVLLAYLTGPTAPWHPPQKRMSGEENVKRRVQHYGYVFDYATANVLREENGCTPLPEWKEGADVEEEMERSVAECRGWNVFAALLQKIRRFSFPDGMSFPNINQVTVNEYTPGVGIGSHVDTPSAFSDGLMSVSLSSSVVMEFSRKDGDNATIQKKLQHLPPRSLLLMTGPARYEWEHAIITRKTDTVNGTVIKRSTRVSLTLRTALNDDNAPLPLLTTATPPSLPSSSSSRIGKPTKTPVTESKHVHDVYDAIAEQWHHTRGKRGVLWPGATHFLASLPRHSLVADVGCGDGKYFSAGFTRGHYVLGSDICRNLLLTAVRRGEGNHPLQRKFGGMGLRPECVEADGIVLPYRDASVDAVLCVAVFHHFSTVERRLRCFEELRRIVAVGGSIYVHALALNQETTSKRQFKSEDVWMTFMAQPRYLNGCDGGEGLDEEKGLVVFKRYCHCYREGELEGLVEQVRGLNVIDGGYESGNWWVLLRKEEIS